MVFVDGVTPLLGRFRPPVRLRWIALGWLAAEVLAFAALVKLIGLGGTILLGLCTTVLGVMLLRRAGRGALQQVRRAATGGAPFNGALADGLLCTLGAVLLIVPGFLANAAGLVLAAPSARHALMARFGGRTPPSRRPAPRAGVIDLGPDDWRPVDRA